MSLPYLLIDPLMRRFLWFRFSQLQRLDAQFDYTRIADPVPLVQVHRTIVKRGPLNVVTLSDKVRGMR
jgi:hypothetical protein